MSGPQHRSATAVEPGLSPAPSASEGPSVAPDTGRVVIAAPVHDYDDIRVFRKEAVTLAAAGYRVRLYARTPDDKPLRRDGVEVVPVPRVSRPARFLNLVRLGVQVYRDGADIYHLHNPDTLPIAFALTALGRTVVYDTHEDFRTEILLRQWLPGSLRRFAAGAVARLESLAGQTLAAVIVTQPQLQGRVPDAIVIGNPPIFDADRSADFEARRVARLASQPDAALTLGYVGGISEDRGLDRMLDLLGALQAYGPTRLILVGPSVNDDALERAQDRPEWQWVDYRGPLPQEEAFQSVTDADAGLILFQDTASHRFIDPNKIYEYLTLALPFIATGFQTWRARFGSANVGLFLDPSASAADAAEQVHQFTRDRPGLLEKGRHGVRFIAERYSWQSQGAPALLDLYARLREIQHTGRTTRRGEPREQGRVGAPRWGRSRFADAR